MKLPEIGERQVIFENWYQRLYRVTADFGEFAKEYFVTDYGQRAGVVVLRNNKVLLVSQYRLLINGPSWEIPGGAVDSGETPEEAARRECLEETGVDCQSLTPLVFFLPGLDTVCNPTHLFYTSNFQTIPSSNGPSHEVIRQQWLPLGQCLDMIFSGEIKDGLTVIALLAYSSLKGSR